LGVKKIQASIKPSAPSDLHVNSKASISGRIWLCALILLTLKVIFLIFKHNGNQFLLSGKKQPAVTEKVETM